MEITTVLHIDDLAKLETILDSILGTTDKEEVKISGKNAKENFRLEYSADISYNEIARLDVLRAPVEALPVRFEYDLSLSENPKFLELVKTQLPHVYQKMAKYSSTT